MIHALSGQWLWRTGEEQDSLWSQVLVAKYGIRRNGWDIQCPTYHDSGLWKGIKFVKETLSSNIAYCADTREKIFFWQELSGIVRQWLLY